MAISTYAELQAAIPEWMERANLTTAQVKNCISLAEARLNRELSAVEADASVQGVPQERKIDISALKAVRALAVFYLDGQDEIPLVPRAGGSFSISTSLGVPRIWSWDDGYISFDCPCDQDYFFRIRYIGRFALSDVSTTNALLTNHPDIYLSACMMWGGLFVEDDGKAVKWGALLEKFIRDHKALVAKQRRSQLTIDPMFLNRCRGRSTGRGIDYVGYGDDVVYYEDD